MSNEDELAKLLKKDPSKMTSMNGQPYIGDEATRMGVMMSQLIHVREKQEALNNYDDTTLITVLEDYLRIVDELGFVLKNKIDFSRLDFDDKGRKESDYWLWHPEYSITLQGGTTNE